MPELYLDTARLGRMCRGARKAEHGFSKLASQLGSSLYLERFLTEGYDALPRSLKRQHPHLRCWQGVSGFQEGLAAFIQRPANLPTYFFGHSNALIRFAAQCLYQKATRVLTTDLEWPPYLEALRQVASERDATLHIIELRDKLIEQGYDAHDMLRCLRRAYSTHACNGVFLSDISYLGFRLPVDSFLRSLSDHNNPFVVIDGAQAFNQRPVSLANLHCDLFLAGSQKWFRSYHPLRIAFVGRAEHTSAITATCDRWVHEESYLDPLFELCHAIQFGQFKSFGETVNLAALTAAAGSLWNAQHTSPIARIWDTLLDNRRTLASWLSTSHWQPINGCYHLHSGILLLRRPSGPNCPPDLIRRQLSRNGIAASVLPDETIRLSMPTVPLPWYQMSMVVRALGRLPWQGASSPLRVHRNSANSNVSALTPTALSHT